jgi:hypothetical protein
MTGFKFNTSVNGIMRIKVKENSVPGLGNNSVPAGYNRPDFSVETAIQPGTPNPEAQLAAASAAQTPNGIDPNKGYQLGGAADPLAEFEPAVNNPAGLNVGGGTLPKPISSPGFPQMASGSFKEDGGENPFDEGEDPFGEGEIPFAEDDAVQTFETADAIPAFEDVGDDPALAALPVDADGVIQPIVIPAEVIEDPELGAIPDVTLPFEEPILDITEDDVDVEIPENVFENDGMPEGIPVVESFKLPENQSVVVSKGDQIFILGHVREEFTPKFAESVFSRAMKSLAESKGQNASTFTKVGQKHEKVASVGRSMLVEVAKDWRLPGMDTIFEAHDLLQIVSAKPVREAEDTDEAEDKKEDEDGKTADKSKKKEDDAEIEKAKKEALLAYRRWKEAAKKNKKEDDDDDSDSEDDDSDDDDDSGDGADKAEKKAKKERAKREAAMLHRQKTGGWI